MHQKHYLNAHKIHTYIQNIGTHRKVYSYLLHIHQSHMRIIFPPVLEKMSHKIEYNTEQSQIILRIILRIFAQ